VPAVFAVFLGSQCSSVLFWGQSSVADLPVDFMLAYGGISAGIRKTLFQHIHTVAADLYDR